MGARKARSVVAGVSLALLAALASGVALAAAGGSAQKGDSSTFIYYSSPTDVESLASIEAGCVFGDHHFGVGGGAMLPFSYRPAQLLNNAPSEPYKNTGGWLVGVKGKGEGNPTPITVWEICSSIHTKLRSASFSVPADGKAHSKTVSCGADERALSGGVSNYPGDPTGDSSRTIVQGYPVDGPDKGHGRGDAWRVTSRASRNLKKRAKASVVCVKASKMDVRYRHLDFVAQKGDFDGVYVDCKESEQVTGGGIQLAKPKPGIRLTTSAPFDSSDVDNEPSNRWATGIDGPNHGKVDATNWAVCAKVP